jgi:hypothetical protein
LVTKYPFWCLRNFQNIFKKELGENLTKFQLNQTTVRKNEKNELSENAEIELKFCEVL